MIKNTFVTGPAGNLEVVINEENKTLWAILCHPHPLYGGNMDDAIVRIVEKALASQRISTLRFNFRGTGFSEGKHDDGNGEVEDLLSIYDWVADSYKPEKIIIAGYSFGAVIAAKAAPQIKSDLVLLVAPPTRAIHPYFFTESTVVAITGSQDDFVNNKDLASLVEKSPNLKVTVIDGADHFFSGKQTNLYTIIESILEAQQT
jgi:alpha/beta superfamily hydrolase|tara:strand:- start:551 stop:1159 length:609 start_codon:yes stop_codon:yes gene_type:complete